MSAEPRLAGKVAIVTGAGGGIGRAHAIELARLGASVVVNDHGAALDGSGADKAPAQTVVAEIEALGGAAVADVGDVGSWNDAEAMVAGAVDRFGRLDILVNNAGILRPKTIVGMNEAEMASVIRVHLLGSFAMLHFAGSHWRGLAKAGKETGGRVINTTSGSGLFGIGQANYAAAKAGIAAMTQIAAAEFERYGVTVNAIAPTAATRMSEGIAPPAFLTEHVARLAAWLASAAAAAVTGRVFQVGGGHVSIVDGWRIGPGIDDPKGWSLAALDAAIPGLVARAAPPSDIMGYRPEDARSPLLPVIALPSGD